MGIRKRRRSQRTSTAARFIGTAVGLAFSTPTQLQAQAIYIHSPSEQKATGDLHANLEAARTTHLAALDRHDAELTSLVQREQTGIVRRALARRDEVIMRYLDGGLETLDAVVVQRLTSLGQTFDADTFASGNAQPFSPDAEARYQADLAQARAQRLALDRQAGRVELHRQVALARNQPAPECKQAAPPDVSASSAPAIACAQLQRAYQNLLTYVRCDYDVTSRTVMAAVVGATLCWDGATKTAQTLAFGGEIGDAIKRHAALGGALARQRQAAKLVGDELKSLEKYVACQNALASRPDATANIAAAALQLDALLKNIIEGAAPAAAVAQRELAPCRTPEESSSSAPTRLDAVLAVLEALKQAPAPFGASRAIASSAAEVAQEFRASTMGAILQAAAAPQVPAESRGAIVVQALVRAAAPVEALARIGQGKLPDTSGALVVLAETRMRAKIASLESQRLERLEAYAAQLVVALSNEALLVRQAVGALRLNTPKPDRAAILYGASVERGRVPAEVLEYAMNNVEFDVWSKRERAAVEGAYAALAPAAEQLKIYGEGGIRPDTIARFLNVAGLFAIAE